MDKINFTNFSALQIVLVENILETISRKKYVLALIAIFSDLQAAQLTTPS